ncbi:MAG: o-succinylbenzoate synthase [Deltaproteobacteria bacterium]|nr:o-succinylbenzoate synthase [Deltaproteobacteria bacterium]
MKIKQVNLYHVTLPLVTPLVTSFGTISDRPMVLVEVRAEDKSDGITGYGSCPALPSPMYSYETISTVKHVLKDYLVPLVLGKALPSPVAYCRQVAPLRGHPMAKSGLEMALWDIQGKREGRSLRELLGGKRKKVDVGVSVGLQASPAALVDTVHEYVADGYRRVKIKIKPGRDVADTRAVRKAFPDLPLQVDANSAYDPDSVNALLPLDDLGLLLIEQPLADDDIWEHSRLQPKFKTPICLDESIISPRHAKSAIEMGAARNINIKQARVGGLTDAVAIHDYCQSQNVPVWCGGMLETGVGRAANLALASLPNFKLPGDISATGRYYKLDITQERYVLNSDSTIDVPTGPGLGITINQEALLRYLRGKLIL